MALMTAELGSAIPEMGGYVLWVNRAFGDFWAFQNAIWHIFANILDNALYPVLFVDYLDDMVGDLPIASKLSIEISIVILIGFVNVIGVDVVGDGAALLGGLVLLPFIVFSIYGFAIGGVNSEHWGDRVENPEYGVWITILLWNSAGYDAAGACASEVENPGRIYPRAMILTVVICTISYLVPIMVGVSFATDYSQWEDGYFVSVGRMIVGGDWLAIWITVSGTISGLGLLNSTVCTTARAISSTSSLGFIPGFFSRIHPRFGTPHISIITNSLVIIGLLLTQLDFESIAQVSFSISSFFSFSFSFSFSSLLSLLSFLFLSSLFVLSSLSSLLSPLFYLL
jgi:amino acid transporter